MVSGYPAKFPSGYLPDIKLFIAFIHNLIPNNTFFNNTVKNLSVLTTAFSELYEDVLMQSMADTFEYQAISI